MTDIALSFHIHGRVQGVSFRAWTQVKADSLNLRGWVRNEPDGTVSGCMAGDEADVQEMRAALHEGPPPAHVDRVLTAPAAPEDCPANFEIRH